MSASNMKSGKPEVTEVNKWWKGGRTFYITAFVTLLIVAIQGHNAFARHAGCGLGMLIEDAVPSGGCSHLPLYLQQLGDQSVPPEGDPSSGDWQRTAHQGVAFTPKHECDDFKHKDISMQTIPGLKFVFFFNVHSSRATKVGWKHEKISSGERWYVWKSKENGTRDNFKGEEMKDGLWPSPLSPLVHHCVQGLWVQYWSTLW